MSLQNRDNWKQNNADWNMEEALRGLRSEIRKAAEEGNFELLSRLSDYERLLARGLRLNYERMRSMYHLGWREGNPVGYLADDYELVEQEDEN